MENPIKSNEKNIEQIRKELAQVVKTNLEKFQSEIKGFSLLTTSKQVNGSFATNDKLSPVSYSSSYDSEYEFVGLPRERNYMQERKSGYLADTRNNFYTFVGPLGRALHTPDRPGNVLAITLQGEKGGRISQELVNSIKNLVDTVKPYEEGDTYEDLKNILVEAIPILEAFEDLSKKFPSNGKMSVTGLITEYKEMLENLSQANS
jgi:hypothetical protein